MNKRKLIALYELIFSAMAIVSVIIALLDLSNRIDLQENIHLQIIDRAIIIIFAVDYFIRLFIANSKGQFIKSNIPDLIAIIPFSAIFKVFRLAKLFRLVKITRLTKLTRFARTLALLAKFKKTASRFLHTNGLIYMLIITCCLVVLGALGIYTFERGTTVNTFWDSIWWSFVTTTTVGYGDISPATGLGRLIAGVLMLFGIGTIGLLTGTVATYFIGENQPQDSVCHTDQILDLSDLDADKFKQVKNFVEFLRNQ